MKLSLTEQETIIRYDRAGTEAIVYTFDPPVKRKLASMSKVFEDVKLLNSDNGSVEYMLPKNLITIRKPHKKRSLSEKEKEAIANRLSKSRKGR